LVKTKLAKVLIIHPIIFGEGIDNIKIFYKKTGKRTPKSLAQVLLLCSIKVPGVKE